MSKIEEILSPDFLLRIVAIESIRHSVNGDYTFSENIDNYVLLKVTAIEPVNEDKKLLSENIYEWKFSGISTYQFDIADNTDEDDYCSFDGDIFLEKILRENSLKETYKLYIQNLPDTIHITIIFDTLEVNKISEQKFIDGK